MHIQKLHITTYKYDIHGKKFEDAINMLFKRVFKYSYNGLSKGIVNMNYYVTNKYCLRVIQHTLNVTTKYIGFKLNNVQLLAFTIF